MSESGVIKSWGSSCARQFLIIAVLLSVIVAGVIVLTVLSVALPLNQNQKVYVWSGGVLLLFFLLVAGIFIWGARGVRRRAAQLDAAFTPLGLTGKAYLWNGRQYHGQVNGRQVDAYFYRGPSLDIYLASPLNTRLGIGLKGRFSEPSSGRYSLPEQAVSEPTLSHLAFYPLDARWSHDLLANLIAREAILRLTTPLSSLEFRNLLFQPEAIQLQINRIDPGSITTQNVQAWLNDLAILAKLAEALPAPSLTAIASPMERRTRLNRSAFTLPAMGITCGIMLVFTALFITLLILLIRLGS